jgi:serine/threonine protein kinase
MRKSEATGIETTRTSFGGGRYQALEVQGRGGTAVVYRARDVVLDRLVALKWLTVPEGASHARDTKTLFEREFRTLSDLSHPNIIEVYDYGVDAGSAFYTMELVEGSDLRDGAPRPWRDACALFSEVCSALSLVHSRGLVHRDVTPRNVRCTREGRAKLIDFGAMAPVGPSRIIVGTPAFAAPEVLYRSSLDARTDLYSLGSALYFVLTGTLAYPVWDFSELARAWRGKPGPPSAGNPEIPKALDALVMSLLSLEPASRPRSAAEVMQRLAAIAGVPSVELEGVSQSYLSAPVVVGRARELAILSDAMACAFAGEGRSVLIQAASGLGRSRLLDAGVLEAKTSGATVLRSNAAASPQRPFSVAEELMKQLVESLPSASVESAEALGLNTTLLEWEPSAQNENDAHRALRRFIAHVSATHAIAIVVDDVDRIDVESKRLLAALAADARHSRLLLLCTAEESSHAAGIDAASKALTSSSQVLRLGPLEREAVVELFRSVFGDVPNSSLVAGRIFDVSAGNPRLSMHLAQVLVDDKKITYDAGVWTLPGNLEALELPGSAEEALRQQLAAMSPLARKLVEILAVAPEDTFTLEQLAAVAGATESDADRAVMELLRRQILNADGGRHSLAYESWASAASSGMSAETRSERHRAIAHFFDDEPGAGPLYHLVEGGLLDVAVDRLLRRIRTSDMGNLLDNEARLSGALLTSTAERCLEAAIKLGRPPRDVNDIREGLVGLSAVTAQDDVYYRVAPAWLEQLKLDSGFLLWASDDGSTDPVSRLMGALRRASERHEQTPERDRVYRPDEAIRGLVIYAVVSIAVSTRTQDAKLLLSLPSLIEPFVPLSRVVGLIHRNAVAAGECRVLCHPEKAVEIWTEVHEQLGHVEVGELPPVQLIRNAIAHGIAVTAAALGTFPSEEWSAPIEADTFQRANALYVRRSVRLQQGDWEGAEELRKQAEQFALETPGRQMFTTAIFIELAAHALARDLLGTKQIIDRMHPLASRFDGWVPWKTLANAELERIRGNPTSARALYEECLGSDLASFGKQESWWPMAASGFIETLVELGHHDDARAFGLAGVEFCKERDIRVLSHGISRALSLAEAKLGDYAGAAQRLERVIDEQRALGITGLQLGASYEARARVAIWAGDRQALQEFGRLTAAEYRYGKNSPLGARYERLINEAGHSAGGRLPNLSEFSSTTRAESPSARDGSDYALDAMRVMQGTTTVLERAARALGVLCAEYRATGGHLYAMRPDARLELLATEGVAPPSDQLKDFLSRHVKDKVIERTTIVDIPRFEESSTTLGERFGMAQAAVFLVDENRRPVALALLVGAAGNLESPLELAEALGAFLVGDAEEGETALSRGGPTSN